MLSSHDPLLDAIAANPDDVAPWTVYGDLLQTQSDPRGELISLMLEREQRPSAKLLETQRELIMRNARGFAPAAFAADSTRLVWRRGFVAEVRVTRPEELVQFVAEPKLRFVDTATLEIDGDDWETWCEELAARQLPWRRLFIELERCPEELDMQVLFAAFPAVEQLRLRCPRDEAPPITWDGADARRLELLVLVDCGEIESLDAAELPSLRELRLLGQTEASPALRASRRWSRLEAVVLSDEFADADDDTTAVVRVTDPIDRDVDEETNAFLVVGAVLDLALVQRIAGRLSGADHLSARVAPLAWLPGTSVLQLYGRYQADLPYDVAIALREVVAPPPPVALVELDQTRGRFLVLGRPAVRDEAAPPSEVVRRALDLALGRDPGFGMLAAIEDELACAPHHDLLGAGGRTILNGIDPTASPLIEPEPVDEDDDYDNDYGDEDGEYGEDDDYYEVPGEAPNEDPVPVFLQLAAELDDYDEPAELFEDLPFEPSEHDALERPELWFAFREHWDDRALDVDDEPDAVRWVDPETLIEPDVDPDHMSAAPACAIHELELEQCTWCGAPLCVACERDEGHRACLAAVVSARHALSEAEQLALGPRGDAARG